MDIGKNLFINRVDKHWNGLPVLESPSLEVFERYVDVMLNDVVLWWDSVGINSSQYPL